MKLNELMDYLEAMVKDEFVAKIEKSDNTISLTFLNGQKFAISVTESEK